MFVSFCWRFCPHCDWHQNFTGTVIGTGAMLAEESTITGAVPSFVVDPFGTADLAPTSSCLLANVMPRDQASPELLQRLLEAFTNLDSP